MKIVAPAKSCSVEIKEKMDPKHFNYKDYLSTKVITQKLIKHNQSLNKQLCCSVSCLLLICLKSLYVTETDLNLKNHKGQYVDVA